MLSNGHSVKSTNRRPAIISKQAVKHILVKAELLHKFQISSIVNADINKFNLNLITVVIKVL